MNQKQIFAASQQEVEDYIKRTERVLRDGDENISRVAKKIELLRTVSEISNIFKNNSDIESLSFTLEFNEDCNYHPCTTYHEIKLYTGDVVDSYNYRGEEDDDVLASIDKEDFYLSICRFVNNEIEGLNNYLGELLADWDEYIYDEYRFTILKDGTITMDDEYEVDLLTLTITELKD